MNKNITPLLQKDYKMKIIKDLGKVTRGSSSRRRAIFECTECKVHFEARAPSEKTKQQLKCFKCSTKRKTNYEHPLYYIWNGIKQRCYNTKRKDFNRYGGAGVLMLQEWKDDSNKFINWCLANGWEPGLQIDKDILSKKLKIFPAIYSKETISFVTPSINCRESRGRAVEQYSLDGHFIMTFDSLAEAGISFGKKNGSSITNTCAGRQKTCYGFKWKYKI